MENSPPGLSGTSHAIVALAANGIVLQVLMFMGDLQDLCLNSIF